MRPVLRLLGTRYGIALVLAVIVLAVVGVTRQLAGTNRSGTLTAPVVRPSGSSSVDPTAGDDSVAGAGSPPPPETSPGAAQPADVAADFTRVWLSHDGVTGEQWRQKLQKYSTVALLGKLKDTDPAGVPAQRMTGPVTIRSRAATFTEANVPVDSGTLHLRLVAASGRWLVDGVDWERQ